MKISIYRIAIPVLVSLGANGCLLPAYEEDPPTECSQGLQSWGLSYPGSLIESVEDLAADPDGNLISVGTHYGTLAFGDQNLNNDAGGSDAFVAKHNADGAVQWVAPIRSSAEAIATHVDVASDGRILVGGTFSSDVTTGGMPKTLNGSANTLDIFVAEYSPDGTPGPANAVTPSTASENPLMPEVGTITLGDLRFDREGNIIVCGTYESIGELNEGKNHLFVGKFDGNHNKTWLIRLLTVPGQMPAMDKNHVDPAAIGFDSNNNIYISGTYGEGSLTNKLVPLLDYSATDRLFFLKLSPGGEILKADYYRGNADADQKAADMLIDNEDNKYILASHFGTTAVDGHDPVATSGYEDLLIIKQDAEDNVVWIKGYGGSGDDKGEKIAMSGPDKLVVLGSTRADISFERRLVSAGNSDIFLAFIRASDGSPTFSALFGDGAEQYGYGLAVGRNGKPYIAGEFDGSLDFGITPIQKSQGDTDLFFARPCQ